MAGIYIHIPFCKQKCAYCDFYSVAQTIYTDQFVDALLKEIELRKKYLEGKKIQTIYFGGGTPSVLSNLQIRKILDSINENFDVDRNNEITIEANPENLTREYLKEIRKSGINRLSIGIQSFIDSDLVLMRRKHSANEAINAVKEAQDVGFSNISVDLIYGLPNLTQNDWENNIDEALKLKIQHISAYHLTIEPNTLFNRYYKNQKIKLPTDDESLDQFRLLKDKTAENGFLHYEISNFAMDGSISLHNTNYWLGVKYLGLGPSAHSYNLTSREWNISNLHEYMEAIFQGKLANETEILSKNEKFNDYVITSLRTMWGLNTEKLKKDFGDDAQKYFLRKSEKFIDQNLMCSLSENYKLTEKGMFISDNIISSFLRI